MKPELSQPTLGRLRRILENMEPKDLVTPYEKSKFWKDVLFDFGFAQAVIDVAASYSFRWGEIIPDLFLARFGEKNSYWSTALPPFVCEDTLRLLLVFALHHKKGTRLADELLESLARDGFDLKSGQTVDSVVPKELAEIPGKKLLTSDIQKKLDNNDLLAVLYLDLDGFKSVNDTLGHAAGDECLIKVARIMAEVILGKGKLYRPGGDEFVVVLHNFTRDEAASTAERIRAAVDDQNPGGTLKVTVSVGVADSTMPQATNLESLINLADQAMYTAKKTKNQVVVSSGAESHAILSHQDRKS